MANKMTLAKSMNFLKRMIMNLVRRSGHKMVLLLTKSINPRRVEFTNIEIKTLFLVIQWYFTWFLSALPFERNNFRPHRHHMCSTPQFFCRGQHYDKSVHIFELFRVTWVMLRVIYGPPMNINRPIHQLNITQSMCVDPDLHRYLGRNMVRSDHWPEPMF